MDHRGSLATRDDFRNLIICPHLTFNRVLHTVGDGIHPFMIHVFVRHSGAYPMPLIDTVCMVRIRELANGGSLVAAMVSDIIVT